MQRLWDDPALAAQMGSMAVERFQQLFTAESMARRHSELYREVLAEHLWGENSQLAVENAERLI